MKIVVINHVTLRASAILAVSALEVWARASPARARRWGPVSRSAEMSETTGTDMTSGLW